MHCMCGMFDDRLPSLPPVSLFSQSLLLSCMIPTNIEESHWPISLPSPASLLPSAFLLPSSFSWVLLQWSWTVASSSPLSLRKKSRLGRGRSEARMIGFESDWVSLFVFSVPDTIRKKTLRTPPLCPFSFLFTFSPDNPFEMNPALRALKNTIRKDIRQKLAALTPDEIKRQCNLPYTILLSLIHAITPLACTSPATHDPAMTFARNEYSPIYSHTHTLSAMSLVRPHITHTPRLRHLTPPYAH